MTQQIRNIVIGGGTGGIGGQLCSALIEAGHNVSVISRSAKRNSAMVSFLTSMKIIKEEKQKYIPNFHTWKDIKQNGLPYETDVVINLSGKTIGNPGFWTENLRQEIRNSRIEPNKTLVKAIQQAETPPKVFISASAVGIYETREEKVYTETDTPCRDDKHNYFTRLCRDWEQSTDLPRDCPTRVCNLRLGVALGATLNPITKLLPLFALGNGGVVGDGKQPFPWIHVADAVSAIQFLIEEEGMTGPVNVVAPQLVDNRQFTDALLTTSGTKESFAVPSFMLQLQFGKERAEQILLNSPKSSPHKLTEAGFQFKYPTIQEALDAIVAPGTGVHEMFLKRIARNKSKS